MINEIVRAGHRYIGLAYLVLGEDGAHPANDDPSLPRYVLRLTVVGGRQFDLTGGPADEMRRHLAETTRPPAGDFTPGRQYSAGRPKQSKRRPSG